MSQAAHELGWKGIPEGIIILLFFVVNGVIGIFASMSTALGEETGWRGLPVPAFRKKMRYTAVSLSSGRVWAVWHYPLHERRYNLTAICILHRA